MPSYVLKGFYKRQLDLYQCFSVLCCCTPAWLADGAEQGRRLPDWLLTSKRFLHSARSTTVRSAGQIQAGSCVGDDVMENTEGKYWWLQKGQDLISVSFMSMPGVSSLRKTAWPSLSMLCIHWMLTCLSSRPDCNNVVLLNYWSIWPTCPKCSNYYRIES